MILSCHAEGCFNIPIPNHPMGFCDYHLGQLEDGEVVALKRKRGRPRLNDPPGEQSAKLDLKRAKDRARAKAKEDRKPLIRAGLNQRRRVA